MKVILSRKGFDSKNGGMPSVIMPNGDMVSMPIPALHGQSYASLHYKGKRYSKLLKELRPAFRERNCHADPDLNSERRVDCPKGWKAAFGQSGSSGRHLLETIGVAPGDLFLFFGNFRFVECRNGRYRFMSRTGDFHRDREIQVIWGYLQVGEVITDQNRIRNEYPWHPHADVEHLGRKNNILIVPSGGRLSFDQDLPGCGILPFSYKRVLTERGESKAVWFDHGVLRPDSIIEKYAYKETRHTVFYRGIWQEMCLKESYEAVDFAKRMLSPRNFQDGKYDELVDQIEEIERQYAEGEIDRDEFVSNLQVVDDDSQDLIEDGDLSSEGFHDFQIYLGEILDRQGVEYAESGIVTP